jgi:methylmalonyl-CoA mutase cobalamin-binding subunit
VAEIFPPGSPLQDIVDFLRERFPEEAAAPA